MKVIYKGGKDTEGTRGETTTFVSEEYYILEKMPIPIFLRSFHVPKKDSIHPIFPWYIAQETKVSTSIQTERGPGVTVTTTYRALQTDEEEQDADTILPWLLPAQDYRISPIRVEEPLKSLWRFGTWQLTDIRDPWNDAGNGNDNWKLPGRSDVSRKRWRRTALKTTAGTDLIGSRQRMIRSVSFWYYMRADWFHSELIDRFADSVNDADVFIAGEQYLQGQVKINELNAQQDKWKDRYQNEHPIWKISVGLHIDRQTWNKQYENIATLFQDHPYQWKNDPPNDAEPDKPMDRVLQFDQQDQPQTQDRPIGRQRICQTLYDPEPEKVVQNGTVQYKTEPKRFIAFFGTREECLRLNPEMDPTEISEPMYLDAKGRIIWPSVKTGMVNSDLAPKIEGYPYEPKDFSELRFPLKR